MYELAEIEFRRHRERPAFEDAAHSVEDHQRVAKSQEPRRTLRRGGGRDRHRASLLPERDVDRSVLPIQKVKAAASERRRLRPPDRGKMTLGNARAVACAGLEWRVWLPRSPHAHRDLDAAALYAAGREGPRLPHLAGIRGDDYERTPVGGDVDLTCGKVGRVRFHHSLPEVDAPYRPRPGVGYEEAAGDREIAGFDQATAETQRLRAHLGPRSIFRPRAGSRFERKAIDVPADLIGQVERPPVPSDAADALRCRPFCEHLPVPPGAGTDQQRPAIGCDAKDGKAVRGQRRVFRQAEELDARLRRNWGGCGEDDCGKDKPANLPVT